MTWIVMQPEANFLNKVIGTSFLEHSSAGTVTEVGLQFFEQLRLQTLPCLSHWARYEKFMLRYEKILPEYDIPRLSHAQLSERKNQNMLWLDESSNHSFCFLI